jgi:hypothetical protein
MPPIGKMCKHLTGSSRGQAETVSQHFLGVTKENNTVSVSIVNLRTQIKVLNLSIKKFTTL